MRLLYPGRLRLDLSTLYRPIRMISKYLLDTRLVLCCPSAWLPLTNLDLLNLRCFPFRRAHTQVFSLQRITYLPPQRALLNPLFINHFRTLFIVTGGVLPPSCLPSSEVQTCGRFNVFPSYSLCFQILAHSFALFCTHARLNPFIFNRFRTLCEKPPGLGGRVRWVGRLKTR